MDSSRLEFKVRGMTCASCERRIEGAILALPGVAGARAERGGERVEVILAAAAEGGPAGPAAPGPEELARLIWKDMEGERAERIQSIRGEMLSVTAKDFWEVIDRGLNFDYLDPERRKQLETFYSWFSPSEAQLH